jgi:predicted deacylase
MPRQSGKTAVFEGDWELASVAGIFRARCRLGDAVEKGRVLADIIDLRGKVQQEFVSPYEGIVLGLRSKARINRGNWAVLVGKRGEIDA